MAPIFGFRRNADEDDRTAGGKIVRSRRRPAAEKTPYSRPTEEPVADRSENPNWLSGLIYPARVVASGAGKVISALMRPDYASSSSSSDGDSGSDDGDAECADDDELNKELSSIDKSENMHLIQQLVMQETFSREECDVLIKLINSRAINCDGTLSNTDARTNAVIEAKKWLKQKKFGTSSKSKGTESEIGSPVDMAKSYMQDRPTWSSTSLKKHVEFETPSRMQKFKEDISKAIFHSPSQLSEMNASGLSAGSWNIEDEIRRVRSKATEELLATTPSKKIDLASFFVEDKSIRNTMTSNMDYVNIGHDVHNPSSMMPNMVPNASVDLAATNSCGLPDSVGMESETLQIGGLENNPTNVLLKQSQDNGTMTPPLIESLQDNVTNQATEDLGARTEVTDPALEPENPHSHDVNGLKNSVVDDDTFSLSAAGQTLELNDKEMTDEVDLSQDKVNGNAPGINKNEPSNLALYSNDIDHIVSGSQESSSLLYKDSLHIDPNHEGKAPRGRRLRTRKGMN